MRLRNRGITRRGLRSAPTARRPVTRRSGRPVKPPRTRPPRGSTPSRRWTPSAGPAFAVGPWPSPPARHSPAEAPAPAEEPRHPRSAPAGRCPLREGPATVPLRSRSLRVEPMAAIAVGPELMPNPSRGPTSPPRLGRRPRSTGRHPTRPTNRPDWPDRHRPQSPRSGLIRRRFPPALGTAPVEARLRETSRFEGCFVASPTRPIDKIKEHTRTLGADTSIFERTGFPACPTPALEEHHTRTPVQPCCAELAAGTRNQSGNRDVQRLRVTPMPRLAGRLADPAVSMSLWGVGGNGASSRAKCAVCCHAPRQARDT